MAKPEEVENMDPNEAQARLQHMRDTCQDLARKINELDMDKNEHRLVVEALKPLDPGRKCFRMVGSIIVERTVAEVLPAVQQNMEQITEAMNKLMENLKTQQKAADEFAAKHRLGAVQGKSAGAGTEVGEPTDGGASQGVLI